MSRTSIAWMLLLFLVGYSTVGAGPKDDSLRRKVVQRAYGYLDVPYRYGGTDRNGLDCSGLVYRVFQEAVGARLPRQVNALYSHGNPVGENLLPGDLVFFNTNSATTISATTGTAPSHVGIYIGENRFIHAASEGRETGVIVSSMKESYYRKRALEARRVLVDQNPDVDQNPGDSSTLNTVTLSLSETPPVGGSSPIQPQISNTEVASYQPLNLNIHNTRGQDRWLTVRFQRDGKELFARRIHLEPNRGHSRLWFNPSVGTWQIQVEDESGSIQSILNLIVERNP